MDFLFDRFVEGWATLYAPMRHTPGIDGSNKRFFICDSYMTMTEFMTNMEPEASPCVIIESQQEGSVRDGKDYPRYALYFMVRASEMNNGHFAIIAKRDAKRVMMDFINFLRAFKYPDDYASLLDGLDLPQGSYLSNLREAVEHGDRCLENIGIEDFAYESINQMYDGWYGVQVTLDDMCVINQCLDPELY